MEETTLEEIIDEQSRTITRLCEAIDPTHTHGPETDKICAYAKQCREFYENDTPLRRVQVRELDNITDGPMPICPDCATRHFGEKCPI